VRHIAAIEGLEMLFSQIENVKLTHLTCDRSSSGTFVRSSLPHISVQEIDTNKPIDFLTNDEDAIAQTPIADTMRTCGAEALMLAEDSSQEMEDWAKNERVSLLSTPWNIQQNLENKLFFQALLEEYGIPTPKTTVLHNSDDVGLVEEFPVIIQDPAVPAKQKLVITNNKEDLDTLLTSASCPLPLLCRAFVTGQPLGVSILIGKNDCIFSALRLQCFSEQHNALQEFLGIQFIKTNSIPSNILKLIEDALSNLASALRSRGFLGVANIDFMLTENGPLFLECNPRLSAATPCLSMQPSLLHGFDFLTEYIRALNGDRLSKDIKKIPNTDWEGCLIQFDYFIEHLKENTNTITTPKTGFYNLEHHSLVEGQSKFSNEPEYLFYSGLSDNFPSDALKHLGLIVCNVPLFSPQKDSPPLLNGTGNQLLEYCKNTFLEAIPTQSV